VFRDVAGQTGLNFVHVNGASDEKFLPEILGAGGLFLDFDNDGWLDVFLADSGSFADPALARSARHRLYRHRRNGTFADVTEASNIRHRDYGMGACAGDVDNDGLIDLYITNVGANVLYRNTGNGRFAEVPNAGGAASALWSTSCAFVDIDRDGDLDLFVTNYVDTSRAKNPFCGLSGPPAIRDYCHPLVYPPLPNVLYRNNGTGAFEDISMQAGVAPHRGNGLGVAVSDVDDDGWPDVFVANDSTPNFLFHNNKNGSFAEISVVVDIAGGERAAYSLECEAGTGVLRRVHESRPGVSQEQFSLRERRAGPELRHVGHDVPVDDREIEPGVVVVIEEHDTEADERTRRGPDAAADRDVREQLGAEIQKQAVHLGLVVGDDQSLAPAPAEVAERGSHPGAGLAVRRHRHSGQARDLPGDRAAGRCC
jgi:hypothetical protein